MKKLSFFHTPFLFPAFTDRSGDLNHINIYGITEKKREELGRLISL